VACSSKKQLIICLASTKEKYKVLCSVTREAIYLWRILEDVGGV